MTEQAKHTAALTMRRALKQADGVNAHIVWYLENSAQDHRLPGLAYTSREAAEAGAVERGFPTYRPIPYLKSKAVERRWETGRGRAGGDVRVGRPFWMLTPIRAAIAKALAPPTDPQP